MNKMDERILVVDRDHLFENETLTFQGVMTDYSKVEHMMNKFNEYHTARRGDAEENEDWKQPIPYAIIKRGDEVFLYERLKAGGEKRLHDQLSIGVGGHMNVIEHTTTWGDMLLSNLYRELEEELDIQLSGSPILRIVGLINDDENEVGRVHIGILATLDVPEGSEVTVRETDQLEGYWVRIRDLKKSPLFDRLENWSQISAEIL